MNKILRKSNDDKLRRVQDFEEVASREREWPKITSRKQMEEQIEQL